MQKHLFQKIFAIGSGENKALATLLCAICSDGFWHGHVNEAKKRWKGFIIPSDF